jgi:hypothetical protein
LKLYLLHVAIKFLYSSYTFPLTSQLLLPLGGSSKDIWDFIFYRSDGRVHIIGEWVSRTKAHRYIVIGPDWACVAMTYIVIITPSVFVAIYLLVNLAEKIIYFILFGLCIFGLTTVFIADPGLVRKYHHARSRHWTYWYTNTMPSCFIFCFVLLERTFISHIHVYFT